MPDLSTMLAEAESALHDLQRGVAVVRLTDQNGESIAYTRSSLPSLSAYVGALKRRVAGKAPVRGFNPNLTRGL